MNRKFHALLISILMFFSMFSVGFSSWMIVANNTSQQTGTIKVDDVERKNFVNLSIIEGTKTNQDGFFVGRNVIKASATIDMASFMEQFEPGSVNSVQASFVLSYAEGVSASTEIFKQAYISGSSSTNDAVFSIVNDKPTLTITLTGNELETNPTIELTFAFNNIEDRYFTASYSPFVLSGDVFLIQARLSVLDVEVE